MAVAFEIMKDGSNVTIKTTPGAYGAPGVTVTLNNNGTTINSDSQMSDFQGNVLTTFPGLSNGTYAVSVTCGPDSSSGSVTIP